MPSICAHNQVTQHNDRTARSLDHMSCNAADQRETIGDPPGFSTGILAVSTCRYTFTSRQQWLGIKWNPVVNLASLTTYKYKYGQAVCCPESSNGV